MEDKALLLDKSNKCNSFLGDLGVKLLDFVSELHCGVLKCVLEKHFNFHKLVFQFIDGIHEHTLVVFNLDSFISQRIKLIDLVLSQRPKFSQKVN